MARPSPAPRVPKFRSPGVRARSRHGFTLVEILIALVVAVLLCGAIAAGLMLVLREESRSQDAEELSLAVRSVTASRALPADGDASALLGGLAVETSRVHVGTGEEAREWDQWSVYRPERPSQRLRLLFPTNGTPAAATD